MSAKPNRLITPLPLETGAICADYENKPKAPFKKSNSLHPLKVLIVYPDYGAAGGIERYIETLCHYYSNPLSLINPVVVCSENGTLSKRLKQQGTKTHELTHNKLFQQPHSRLWDRETKHTLLKIIKQENPDVIHLHIGGLETDWFKEVNIPVVMTWHGYGTLYQHSHINNPIKKLIKTKLLNAHFTALNNNVDYLTFISQEEQEKTHGEGLVYPENQQHIIANGVDTDSLNKYNNSALKKAFRKSYGIPDNAHLITFSGRLDQNKQPLLFLSLITRLLRDTNISSNQPIYATVAGTGPEEKKLFYQLNRLPAKITRNIKMLGHLNNVYPLIAASDVVIHPSKQEGFGLGVLEAMAIGTPVVASNVGGLKKLLENFPQCQADPNKASEFYQKIVTLINQDDDNKKCLSALLQQEAKHYDAIQTATQTMEVYRHVCQ